MSKEITIIVSDEVYEFLELKSDDTDTVAVLAAEYLEEGINLEMTLRQ